ncbi:MAG: D-alanyl-D-alanine carboxypeptidase family protein [Pseudomonadota bacterium]|nr:D-alanyl-D-alanine carboxypeptidase family protein [Pseudomonadota bacterium]MEE3260789.1 D-alanyl-D-alanine carboxypeptidase family protein [Pseudomonadota bacterium]
MKKNLIKLVLVFFFILKSSLVFGFSNAKQAVLIDADTGYVLYEKNADELTAPSSMSKMMTIYLIFEKLQNGTLSLTDQLEVSKAAWAKRGSRMFLEENSQVSVEDLLRGIIVQSGNDACVVIAEAFSGTEENFSEELNIKARGIGLENSNFTNSTGWPDEGHLSTARDLSIIAIKTVQNFPEYYHFYAEESFEYNGINQRNRNTLLNKPVGVDGLKTGHTEAGGYGLAASALRKNQRLIMVINGLTSNKERTAEAIKLLEWGYRNFTNFDLLKEGMTVLQAKVWLGDKKTVPLIIDKDTKITIPSKSRDKLQFKIEYDSPISAPIEEGTKIAELEITAPGIDSLRIPLYAGSTITSLGPLSKLLSVVDYLVWGE